MRKIKAKSAMNRLAPPMPGWCRQCRYAQNTQDAPIATATLERANLWRGERHYSGWPAVGAATCSPPPEGWRGSA